MYKDVKFLDIPTIKDVWKWRNGPELKEILDAPFDQKVEFLNEPVHEIFNNVVCVTSKGSDQPAQMRSLPIREV